MRASRCDELEPLHSAWVDDELSVGERARLAAHLQRCARCRAALRQLRVTQSMLRSLPVHQLPAALVPAGAEVQEGAVRRRSAVGRIAVRSSAALVAVTLTLGAAAFAAGGEQPSTAPKVAVPVDVYVADHLVRAVGGPASTPALLHVQP